MIKFIALPQYNGLPEIQINIDHIVTIRHRGASFDGATEDGAELQLSTGVVVMTSWEPREVVHAISRMP